MDFENDMRIDESALDVEWLNQASLAMQYGRYWAEKVEAVQLAEEHVKLIRAELIQQANEDPDTYLGEGVKPTAVNVESYYRTHRRHKNAKEKLIKTQYELNIAEIAKNEISRTRKAALQNLVVLHGQNYFAGPSVPRDLTYESTQKQVQRKSDKKIKMKRKKD